MNNKKKDLRCTIKGKKKQLYFSLNFVFKNDEDFLEQISTVLSDNEVAMEDVYTLNIGLAKDKPEVEEGNGNVKQ